MGGARDFMAMSEYLGELRAEVSRMPTSIKPIGNAILETLTKARDRMMQDAKEIFGPNVRLDKRGHRICRQCQVVHKQASLSRRTADVLLELANA